MVTHNEALTYEVQFKYRKGGYGVFILPDSITVSQYKSTYSVDTDELGIWRWDRRLESRPQIFLSFCDDVSLQLTNQYSIMNPSDLSKTHILL